MNVQVGDAFMVGRQFGVVLGVNEERGVALIATDSGRSTTEASLAAVGQAVRLLQSVKQSEVCASERS